MSLELSSFSGEHTVALETVFSTTNLPVTAKNLATRDNIERWTYLADIEIDRIDKDVGLLIGCDAPQILEPLELRRSQDGGPYATKTIFGWAINGPLKRRGSLERTTNFVQAVDAKLESQFKNLCDLEFNDASIITKRRYRKDW